MRIAIDIREAAGPKPTGKGRWTAGVLQELLRRDHDLILLTDRDVPDNWRTSSVQIKTFPLGIRWHVRAASFLRKCGGEIDAYLSPTSFIVPAFASPACPIVPVVHDLIAFHREPHDRKARWIERLTLGRALRRAAHVYTISNATRDDLCTRFPRLKAENVTTVFAGPIDESPPQNMSDGSTILCVSTLCPRKNQLRLIQAYRLLPSSLRERSRLMLAGGRGWDDACIVQTAKETPGVEWTGYIGDDRYRELLSHCAVFAFPSLYEGFGLPVLDAMQRGIPVLTSSRGSLHEVSGEAALLVDPTDTGSIARGLERLLTDRNLQEKLRAAGPLQARQFSWKRTVDLILAALETLKAK